MFIFQIGPVAHPPKETETEPETETEKDAEAAKTQNEINGTKF